jgi:pyridoxal phosphate enzyme (YggS family)
MISIKDNLDKIKAQINQACQKNSHLFTASKLTTNKEHISLKENSPITLIAVSKKKPSKAIEQAYLCGQKDFGENYLQEAINKIGQLSALTDICWHFIGPIQSNKTKQIAQNFTWVHSVDREKVALRLNQHLNDDLKSNKQLNICLQVNINNEASKSGINEEQVLSLAEIISNCDRLTLRGLMAIPEKNASTDTYKKIQQLYNSLKCKYATVDTLSLGMSSDLDIAIAHGSTMVRIGTAIFGARESVE